MRTRVESARLWLLSAQPRFHEEQAFKLLGLTWAGSNRSEIQKLAAALLSEQREDGGWSQLRTLESDAYATGQALFALHEGGLPALIPLIDEACSFFWILNVKMAPGTCVRDLSRFNRISKADFLTVAINSFQQLAPVGPQ